MNETETQAREECVHHVRELQAWLDSHQPRADWSADMYRARADRLRSLMMWRAKLSLLSREARP